MGDAAANATGAGRAAGTGHPVGTKAEFLAFYRLAITPVYRSASRLTGGDRQMSDDLVQEAFMDLVREVRDGTLITVDIGWLVVAVRHRYIDALRRRQREQRRLRLVATQTPVGESSIELYGSTIRVDEMLAALPETQRVAIVLHHVDGLSVAEIATALDRSEHATESLLARGRERLRRFVRENPDAN